MTTQAPNTSQRTFLNFEQVLTVVRRRSPWILVCVIAAAGAAFAYSRLQTKQYTATASLIFSTSNLSQSVAGLAAAAPDSSPQSLQDTNVELVTIGDMAARTALSLGHGLTKSKVQDSLTIAPQGDTNVVNVSATSASPTLAREIANTYSKTFVTEQQQAGHQYYVSALATVDRQIAALSPRARLAAEGLALQERAQSLATLAELPGGMVQIAAVASLPTSPSSPKVTRNTVVGALLGLVIGLGLTFLLERLDQRILEPKDLEAIFRLPLLGVVPESKALTRDPQRASNGSLPARETEAFQFIRAHLSYFAVDRELRTLLVASAGSGDGKTTISKYLADAAANAGSRVLLIEADLRRPTLGRWLGLDAGPGLTDVLIGTVSLIKATQVVGSKVSEQKSRAGDGQARPVSVLLAGATRPPNPGELLESQAMEKLLAEAAVLYDIVIIDTSPLTAVSDSFSLLRKVDGVVVVGRLSYDRRDMAKQLHETLVSGGSTLLGVVANGYVRRTAGTYGYEYGYTSTD